MKRTVVLLILLALLSGIGTGSPPRSMSEAYLKSVLLYKICKYTHWSRAMPPGRPIVVAFLGKVTPGNDMSLPREKKISGRMVVIRRVKKLSEVRDSHALFIAESESSRLNEILAYIGDKDILTIGDTPGFAQRGIILNFYLDNKTVKFEINRQAEKLSAIRLSSLLLSVSRIVEYNENG